MLRDLKLGQPISAQPSDFQEFACGTNGGPASLPLNGFADFARCKPEATGLHEVQFRYDDESYYRALAAHNALMINFLQGTRFGNFYVVPSALFDDAGILRGIRAVTDDRVDDRTRGTAHALPDYVRALYGSDDWTCVQVPPDEGDMPYGNRLVKQDCRRVEQNGLAIATQERLFRRAGQSMIDPANGNLRPGMFVSTGRMEVYQTDATGNPVYGGAPKTAAAAPLAPAPAPTDARGAFLAGVSVDCAGCDLSKVDLRRRKLDKADLTGANLSGAILHRASLQGAKLDHANLAGADLNLANLQHASLLDANLTNALMYKTDASAANLTGAILDHTVSDEARFTQAIMGGVSWQKAVGLGTNLAGADLTGANLTGTILQEANLQRAKLGGADLTDASFYRARLNAADLHDATVVNADFLEADLSNTILTNANLSKARLLRARTGGADMTGAIMTGAIQPDGAVSP